MPVSTRQTTPGPSNRNATVSQPVNIRKRAGSEGHEGPRDPKKMKLDGESMSQISSVSAKDKKKKKKKKKKRVSVVQSDSEVRTPTRAKSGSVSVSPAKSRARAAVPSGESVPSNEANNHSDKEAEEVAIMSSSDKGKGKAKSTPGSPFQRDADAESHSTQPIASGSNSFHVNSTESTSQASEIALLKEQLAAQAKLIERHETHLENQHQSLTCQICLDLMYKPYALSPCGHITCYGCLVRWFTAPQNPKVPALGNGNAANAAAQEPDSIEAILTSATARNGSYIRRRKKCPVCRAIVVERPVEMWGIKDMVSALARSNLVDIPPAPASTPPNAEEGANADPWRNVFRRSGSTGAGAFEAFFRFAGPAEPREQDDGDREQMGWFDAEDGGIHRCIDCYHEIWDGVCSACRRAYPGHGRHNDDDDDDEHDDHMYMRRIRREMELDTDDSEDEEDEGYFPFFNAREHLQAIEDHLRNVGEMSDEDEDEAGGDDDEGNDVWGGGVGQIEEVEDDEEDSDYGGSFIDDGDDDEVEVVEGPHRANVGRRRYLVVDDSSEDEDEEEAGPDVVDLDEDEDEDEDEVFVRRRPQILAVSDDSDSGHDTEADKEGNAEAHQEPGLDDLAELYANMVPSDEEESNAEAHRQPGLDDLADLAEYYADMVPTDDEETNDDAMGPQGRIAVYAEFTESEDEGEGSDGSVGWW